LLILLSIVSVTLSCNNEDSYNSNGDMQNTEIQKPAIHSHTGYIKSCSTGQDSTTFVFQDGFTIQFIGCMRTELLPLIGTKLTVEYKYNYEKGGNIITKILVK